MDAGSLVDADLAESVADARLPEGIRLRSRITMARGRGRSAGSAGMVRQEVSRRAVGRASAVEVSMAAGDTRAVDGGS